MRIVDGHATAPAAVHRSAGRTVWVMDSIAFGSPALRGDVIVTGSHGGISAGEYAASYGIAMVACNDAGQGKNAAGIAGLRALDRAGVAAVGIAHDSARIGDGHDTWDNGVVSFVNERARLLGIRPGRPLKSQIVALVDRGGI
ncbi:hypothetical protein amrb99_35870 [Actinomadura sp. RB99]|uniref:hypothetical protein n=1 Tax=Actinomadura sp. RB99 TaxID=2691577 RepID=UPI00199E04A8|nr:hypothetical protein [Actinomadura sp. RB99]MBD2894661.1 hypothetical protein [Actinomadura sp. RB99]